MDAFFGELEGESGSMLQIASSIICRSLHEFSTCDQLQLTRFLETLLRFQRSHSQRQNFQQEWAALISPLLDLLQSEGFDYNLAICRRIFNAALRIINLILGARTNKETLQTVLAYLKEKNRVMLDHLRLAIREIAEEESAEEKVERAQWRLGLGEEATYADNYEVALTFVRLACQHAPFAVYLRSQQTALSIDFVELIFGLLSDFVSRAVLLLPLRNGLSRSPPPSRSRPLRKAWRRPSTAATARTSWWSPTRNSWRCWCST